jgi:hypothetical protein
MRMRILIATVLLAASLPGALILHRHTERRTRTECIYATCAGALDVPQDYRQVTVSVRPSWADPAALVALIVGVGFTLAVLVSRRPS